MEKLPFRLATILNEPSGQEASPPAISVAAVGMHSTYKKIKRQLVNPYASRRPN